jgi:hypothetical protein
MGNILHNLQQGLVGHWDMNGNAKDKTPYGNNGTVTGATLTTDRFGQANRAYSFDGDDVIRIADKPEFNFGSQMSAFIWVKMLSTGNQYNFFSHYDTGADKRVWTIARSSSRMQVLVSNNGTLGTNSYKQYASTDLTIFNNTWKFVGFTFNNNTLKLYVDGVEISVSKTRDDVVNSVFNSDVDITIGSALNNNVIVFPLIGSLGSAYLYNRALSATEVSTLYKLYNPNI